MTLKGTKPLFVEGFKILLGILVILLECTTVILGFTFALLRSGWQIGIGKYLTMENWILAEEHLRNDSRKTNNDTEKRKERTKTGDGTSRDEERKDNANS